MDDELDVVDEAANEDVQPDEELTNDEPETDLPEDDEAEGEDEGAEDASDEDAEAEDAETPAAKGDDKPAADTLKLDGADVPLAEVREGLAMRADYQTRMGAFEQRRVGLEKNLQETQQVIDAFSQFVAKQIPPEPDQALAYSNPTAYMQQKAVRDNAMRTLEEILSFGRQAKGIAGNASSDQRKATSQNENAALARVFPETAKPESRKTFFEGTWKAAQKFGFTSNEMNGVLDHRMFVALHWAQKGLEAAAAEEAAKTKIRNAKDNGKRAAPNKPATGATNKSRRNAQAKARLAKSGSLDDALAIDFE